MNPFPNQKRKWSKQEKLAANNINALNLDSANHDGTLSMNRHAQKHRENEKFKEEERKKLWGRQLARLILRCQGRCPGIPVLIAEGDAKGALCQLRPRV